MIYLIKQLLWVMSFCFVFSPSYAQATRSDAIGQLAQIFADQQKQFEARSPALTSEFIVSNLIRGGATNQAAATYAKKYQKNNNKDNLARGFAVLIKNGMSNDEIQQSLQFFNSSAGKKFAELVINDKNPDNELLKHVLIFGLTCKDARAELNSFDQEFGKDNQHCRGF